MKNGQTCNEETESFIRKLHNIRSIELENQTKRIEMWHAVCNLADFLNGESGEMKTLKMNTLRFCRMHLIMDFQ